MKPETLDEFKEQFNLCSDKVKKNCRIVTAGEINQNYMLHIAMKRNLFFIPYFSKIANEKEDNTIARVHVAPTLHGCIIGAAVVNNSLIYVEPQEKLKGKKSEHINLPGRVYLGGWYIHKILFDVCLKPNKALVFDAVLTDEHWLITYNEETRKYPAIVSGKFIPIELRVKPQLGMLPVETLICLVEITDQEGINLNNTIKLEQGYWEVHLSSNYDKFTVDKSFKSTKAEFEEQHKLKAGLLSFTEKPAFSSW